MDAKRLRFGGGDRQLRLAERGTAEWDAQLTDFLTEMEAWKAENEPAATDFFHEKSILYLGLLELVLKGPDRSKIMDAFVDFLERSATLDINRSEWLLSAETALHRLQRADGREELILAFLNSSDSTLRLYGRLAQQTNV